MSRALIASLLDRLTDPQRIAFAIGCIQSVLPRTDYTEWHPWADGWLAGVESSSDAQWQIIRAGTQAARVVRREDADPVYAAKHLAGWVEEWAARGETVWIDAVVTVIEGAMASPRWRPEMLDAAFAHAQAFVRPVGGPGAALAA